MKNEKPKKEIPKPADVQVSDITEHTEKVEYLICPVCGHPNKTSQGICEECNNYLFSIRR